MLSDCLRTDCLEYTFASHTISGTGANRQRVREHLPSVSTVHIVEFTRMNKLKSDHEHQKYISPYRKTGSIHCRAIPCVMRAATETLVRRTREHSASEADAKTFFGL